MKNAFWWTFWKEKTDRDKIKGLYSQQWILKGIVLQENRDFSPYLDKILNGEIDSKSTFDKHLNKILTSLSIDPDTLMGFSPRVQSVDAVFSENAPIDYQVNDKAKMEYDLLQDILNLCSVYY